MKKFLFLILCTFILTSQSLAAGLIGRTQGMRLVASGTFTAANARVSYVAGTAFVCFDTDISAYAGTDAGSTPYFIQLQDASGDIAQGYCGANGSGETLSAELVGNGTFSTVSTAAAKSVTGITKANPGVVTFAAGHGYINGNIIYFSGLTQMTELNIQYWQLRANSGDTFQLATVYDTTSLDTSGYGGAETTGGNCAQKITYSSSWTLGTGMYIGVNGAGALTGVVVGISASVASYNFPVIAVGKLYKYGFDLVSRTAGTIRYGGSGMLPDYQSVPATYSSYGVATSVDTLYLYPDTFSGTVDNATAKQVTDCAVTGLHVMSAKNGTVRNWYNISATFGYNDAMSYRIYKVY